MINKIGLVVAMIASVVVVGLLILGVYTATSAESEPIEPLVYGIGDGNYVYEFRPKSSPDMLCIWLDSYQSGGLQCWFDISSEGDSNGSR